MTYTTMMRLLACILFSLLASGAGAASQAELPGVVILATGGTIAGVQPREGDAGYAAGTLSVDSLIAAAPGLDRVARITGEQGETDRQVFRRLVGPMAAGCVGSWL